MLQNTRTRLVAPGFASPAGREAPVFEPWTDLPGGMDRLVSAVLRPDAADSMSTWVPAVDVEEREDAVRLAFEVPGVAADALDVTVDDRVLTVSGERRFAPAENGASAYRLERRYGRFVRSVALPKTVDPARIEARYEHGVLHLELPKRPEAQPRRIPISTTPAEPAPGAERRLDAGPDATDR